MAVAGEPGDAAGGGGRRHFLDVSPRRAQAAPPMLPGTLGSVTQPVSTGHSAVAGWAPAPGTRPMAGRQVRVTRRMPAHAGRTAGPDAGSRSWGLVALLAAFVLVPIVIIVQQAALAEVESQWRSEEEAAGPDGPISPPGFDQFTIASKAFVKMNEAMRTEGRPGPWAQDEMASSMLETYTATLPEEVRLAIVKGEISGAHAALEHLDETLPYVEPNGALWEDIHALEKVYELGPAALTAEQRDGLTERHGWYGQVALTYGAKKSDPARQDLLSGGWSFLWSMLVIMLVLGAGFVGAVAFFIMALIKIATGQLLLRLEMPAPGGSVYLETFVVFMAAFVALLGVSTVIERDGGRLAEWSLLAGPWVIAPAVLWPLVRGVPWKRYRHEIGWHRGEGVLKEIGCGIAGYLASVPMYIAVVIVMVMLEMARMAVTGEYDETSPPGELPFDLGGEDRWVLLAGLMALLTIWAPLIEETVFRGALLRHLTSRLHWLAAAAVTAVIFGAIHPYPVLGIVPVAFLGYVFGIMRRWRGSLIAPITAHALHNGTVGAILVVLMLLVAE